MNFSVISLNNRTLELVKSKSTYIILYKNKHKIIWKKLEIKFLGKCKQKRIESVAIETIVLTAGVGKT